MNGRKHTCLVGRPALTVTLTEVNGLGDELKSGNSNCFIATAAYGTKWHQHLDLLRWFRDTYLLKTSLGRKAVDFYYRHSPEIADQIAKNEALKSVVRAGLWLPITYVGSIQTMGLTNTLLLTGLALVFVLFVVGQVRFRLQPQVSARRISR